MSTYIVTLKRTSEVKVILQADNEDEISNKINDEEYEFFQTVDVTDEEIENIEEL